MVRSERMVDARSFVHPEQLDVQSQEQTRKIINDLGPSFAQVPPSSFRGARSANPESIGPQ
jgi:hypothetical protein